MSGDYNPNLIVEGDGPLVVLIPGLNGSGQIFYRQIPRLKPTYRVATYTLRDDAPSLKVLAEELREIVDQVASTNRRAIVVGESFGGAVALTFALAYPDRVEGLVILNSFPHFSPQIRLTLALAALAVLPWGAMRAVRQLTAWRFHSRHTHRAEVQRFIELTSDATRHGYVNRLQLLRDYDVRDGLRRLQPRVLFLAAEEDHLVPAPSEARYMADRAPHSSLRILDGHGHICLIAPDLNLADIIDQWREDAEPLAS
jgi:pimeloyl-ACP methyl ester carboxylesterase